MSLCWNSEKSFWFKKNDNDKFCILMEAWKKLSDYDLLPKEKNIFAKNWIISRRIICFLAPCHDMMERYTTFKNDYNDYSFNWCPSK